MISGWIRNVVTICVSSFLVFSEAPKRSARMPFDILRRSHPFKRLQHDVNGLQYDRFCEDGNARRTVERAAFRLYACQKMDVALPGQPGLRVGRLTSSMAERLGLPQSVRICAGAGDNAAAAIGTGTVGDAQCNISLGTSGTVFISSESFVSVPNNALHAFAHATDVFIFWDACFQQHPATNGGWNKSFTRTVLRLNRRGLRTICWEQCDYFLPYLMGERSPHNDAAQKDALLGFPCVLRGWI